MSQPKRNFPELVQRLPLKVCKAYLFLKHTPKLSTAPCTFTMEINWYRKVILGKIEICLWEVS